MTGLDRLRDIIAGKHPAPPMAQTLGFALAEVGEGRAVFTVTPGERHMNPLGVVHGGLAATLLDSATGCAVHTLIADGASYTTLELKVNFVKAIRPDTGPMRAEAEVIHAGKRIATAQGRLIDAKGILYAHATCTCMILEK
jgi:uncharacterized protein (TIGR00369 family)